MVKKQKLFEKMINSPKNIRFEEFILLLEAFGFVQNRVRGSHHIFVHDDIIEILSIQSNENGKAKPYQIRQFIRLIEQYALTLNTPDEDNDE
jgi:predicted RNA binding protein YcfA (HicA-like mRNA interferase family)